MKEIPKMPTEYIGQLKKGCGYTKNQPREWTEKEIEWVKKLLNEGYTNKEIAVSINRSEVSTSIKIKRLSKNSKTYNSKHIEDKYKTNLEFINHIKPKNVLDVYAGEKSFYAGYSTTTNDLNKKFATDYNMDALQFCCLMYTQNKKFDLVDLDPFGSAYDSFDLAIKMAQKGIAITLGELGHKRWKRLDYVSRYYGINNLEEFTIDNLIEHIQMIGRRNKKELIVYAKREWQNIGRVWFEIKPMKITEQWQGKICEE